MVEGGEVARMLAYRKAFNELENRVKVFVSLPLQRRERAAMQSEIDATGG